jgi:DNA-binding NtrC family response regulator
MTDQVLPIMTDAVTGGQGLALKLKLVVVSGPDFGREIILEPGTYRVGKDEGLELTLQDTTVSRLHLVLEVLEKSVRVRDAGSRNGSFYGETKFSQIEAQPLAVIRIGRTELKFMPATQSAPRLPPSTKDRFGGLVGKSLKMREMFALLERVAPTEADLYIRGETGTGKEVCAEAVHKNSARASGPFIVCDLASVAPNLFESELFGHVKGSYTGAQRDRAGAFERAHRGTLFLDEVGELASDIQPRLLRFLERRQVKRVGGNEWKEMDVRVIAATHRDLEAEVKAGRFREDLFHRLSVITIELPALRDRAEDILPLVDEMLNKLGKPPTELSAETRALLTAHRWPGNVRELRNVVERALYVGTADIVAANEKSGPGGAGSVSFKDAKERLVNAFEHDYLKALLARCGGNVTAAAREAGLDRVHLHRLIKKHGIPN